MDADRFDAVARSFAHPTSRRRLLSRLAGIAAGGALALVGRGGTEAARRCGAPGERCSYGHLCCSGTCDPAGAPGQRFCSCPEGTQRCNGACSDTASDPANCGACGTACEPGDECVGGVCRTANPCAPGQAICGGFCADLQTDTANCGICGGTCGSGETCVGGACVTDNRRDPCLAIICGSNKTCCGGACVDVQTNHNNCGICGNSCPFGGFCAGGACQGDAILCPPEAPTACGRQCADLLSDSANRGACGNQCQAGSICCEGSCCNGICSICSYQQYHSAVCCPPGAQPFTDGATCTTTCYPSG